MVMSHRPSPHVLWQQLVSQFRVRFRPQDVRKVVQLMGSRIHEIMDVHKLWFRLLAFILLNETLAINLVNVLPFVSQLSCLVCTWR
jgi:hypothetical protein